MGLSYHSNRKRCRIRMIVSLVLKHFSHNFSQPIRLFPILADSFVVELLAVELFNC